MQLYNNKGVTLIESLVSILLVSIALGVLLVTFAVGRGGAPVIKPRMRAINKIREEMEIYRGTPFANINSQVYNPYTLDDRGTPETSDDIITKENGFSSDVDVVENCKRVTIIMEWQEKRGEETKNMQESLVTLIANHGG